MKHISVRCMLPYGIVTALSPHFLALNEVVAAWNAERKKRNQKHVYASVTVGSMQLPPVRDDKGVRVAMFAEFCAYVGIDHGNIYGPSPELVRDELIVLAAAFDAKLAEKSLVGVLFSEITVDLCVWSRDDKGVLGEMKVAA